MKSIFLDTNIILDFLDSQRQNHNLTRRLLTKIIEDEYRIFISEDMLSTIFYIIKNKQAALEFFKLILAEWEVIPFGKETITEAIALCLQNVGQDFEDTLQCLCARNAGCELLISRDNHFVDCGIRVMDAKTFFDQANS